MAFTLPFLGFFKGVILVGITVSLVNVWYAFMLNPASAELGNVVDRSGLSCYSACYAVYNIFYSVGHVRHRNARFRRRPIAQLPGCFAVRHRNSFALYSFSY